MSRKFDVLTPDLQISFFFRLKMVEQTYLQEPFRETIKKLEIKTIDQELSKLVSKESLNKLATFSLRGEAVFPVPSILKQNPFLLGYYRLLLGFSQKEFYSKGPFGLFKLMEEKGRLSNRAEEDLDEFCTSMIESAELLVSEIDEFSPLIISNLQLLTVGPQFRGSKNNEYGQIATQKTFQIIKEIVKDYIISASPTSIEIKNDSGRIVTIEFSADPDIEIKEKLASGERGLVSIEIKGGKDVSNIHNRIGEAEKSHQKAKKKGYFEFITILSVEIDYAILKEESPTTSHFYNLDQLLNPASTEHINFRGILTSMLSIRD